MEKDSLKNLVGVILAIVLVVGGWTVLTPDSEIVVGESQSSGTNKVSLTIATNSTGQYVGYAGFYGWIEKIYIYKGLNYTQWLLNTTNITIIDPSTDESILSLTNFNASVVEYVRKQTDGNTGVALSDYDKFFISGAVKITIAGGGNSTQVGNGRVDVYYSR